MDDILTSAMHSAKSTYFFLRVNYSVVIWKRANVTQHGLLNLQTVIVEPMWFVQHVHVDSDDVDSDD